MLITTVTQKGQVTIPLAIRKKLKVKTGSKLEFVATKDGVKVQPVRDFFAWKGSVKPKRRFSQKLIKDETKAAETEAVREYLQRTKEN